MTEEDKLIIAQALTTADGFATLLLKMKLHPKQKEVLRQLFLKPKNKVSFRCGNELGKTQVVAVASVLYALSMRDAFIVYTSATYRQIISQFMPALKRYSNMFPNWEFGENKIKINGELKFIAFSSDNEGNWQGYHSKEGQPLFIFTDESAALSESTFAAISRCNPDWLCCAGSPLGPEGVWYSIETHPETSKKFYHVKFNKFDALKKDGWWIEEQDIHDFIQQWGGETHPLVLSSVYAEFATQIEDGLLSLSELTKCYSYPPKEAKGQKHIGIDFAAGNDSNVVAYRNGNVIKIIKVWAEKDTMLACQEIANILNELKEQEDITESQVSADADGLGLPMLHRLKDLGWSVNAFHGNSTPTNDSYNNKISECWLDLAKSIKTCSVILPDNNEFRLQILSRKQTMTSKGKLALEPKSEMRSRGIRSPDCADACAICFSNPSSGNLTYTHKINIEPRKYSFF